MTGSIWENVFFGKNRHRRSDERGPGIASLRLTIVLLLLIAAVAMVGTLVVQRQPPAFYAHRYGDVAGRLIRGSGADRIFTSVLFIGLLMLLAANLAACLVRSARIHLAAGGSKRFLVGLHLGLLVAGCGAMMSAVWRQSTFYQLVSGQRVSFPGASASVEVKNFDILFYPGSDQPQEFRTTVRVQTAGRHAQERVIRVNQPLTVGGYTLYQSSFEVVGKVRVSVEQGDTVLWQGWLTIGEALRVPGRKTVVVRNEAMKPDAVFLSDAGVQSRSYRLRNLGFLIGVYEEGAPGERYWWNEEGVLEPASPRFLIRIEQVDAGYATILKTVKDPGFSLVTVGFTLVGIAGAAYAWRRERETAHAFSE